MKTIKVFSTLTFLVISMNVTAQLKVFSDGSVSIGGTSAIPWPFKLQVAGNTVFSQTQSSITSAGMIRGLNTYSTATTPDFTWFNNDQTGLFHPAINTIGITVDGTERMRINSSGRLFLNTTTDYGSMFNIYAYNTRAAYFDVSHTSDQSGFTVRLDREGSQAYVLNYNSMDRFFVFGSGLVYGLTYYSWSDAKLKEDVKTIENALEKVLQLRGVTFKYKKEEAADSNIVVGVNQKTHIGVVAQEVENILPEVVTTAPDGTKAVAYSELVGVLIEAIKEQNEKIETLEEELEDIKHSNSLENGDGGKNILYQNQPNPFNEKTLINYFIKGDGAANAQIHIFNMQGTLIKTYHIRDSGEGRIEVSGSDLNPGMYMYTLIVDGKEIDTKKMILTQ